MPRTTETDVIKTVLEVDDRDSAKLSKHADNIEDMERRGTSGLDGLKASYLAAAAAVAGFIRVGQKLIELSKEQELAEKRLQFVVSSFSDQIDESAGRLQRYASTLQDLTGYGDEVIIPLQTRLIQMAQLSGDELDRATRLTLDFADSLGIDLATASLVVAKAAGGYTSALTRYGITIDETIPKAEKFTAVLDGIEEKFGGTASVDSYTRSTRGLDGALGDLGETLGEIIRPSNEFIDFLTEATKATKELVESPAFQKFVAVAPSLFLGGYMTPNQIKTLSGYVEPSPYQQDVAGLRAAEAGAGVSIPSFVAPPEPPAEEGGGGMTDAEKKAREIRIAAIQAQIEAEEQMLIERNETYLAIQESRIVEEQATEAERIRQIEENALREVEIQKALADEIEKAGQRKIAAKQAEIEMERVRVEAVRTGFQALTLLFPKAKAFAKAEALVSTYQAITNALATKPFVPAGLAAAALAASRGFAAVRAIDQSGVSVGGGSGGAVGYSYGGATGAVNVGNQGDRNITIKIEGGTGVFTNEEFMAGLAKGIGDFAQASGGYFGNVKFITEE